MLWHATDSAGAEAVAGNLVYGAGTSGQTINIRRLSDGTLLATLHSGNGFAELTPAGGHVYAVTPSRLYAFAPTTQPARHNS